MVCRVLPMMSEKLLWGSTINLSVCAMWKECQTIDRNAGSTNQTSVYTRKYSPWITRRPINMIMRAECDVIRPSRKCSRVTEIISITENVNWIIANGIIPFNLFFSVFGFGKEGLLLLCILDNMHTTTMASYFLSFSFYITLRPNLGFLPVITNSSLPALPLLCI